MKMFYSVLTLSQNEIDTPLIDGQTSLKIAFFPKNFLKMGLPDISFLLRRPGLLSGDDRLHRVLDKSEQMQW